MYYRRSACTWRAACRRRGWWNTCRGFIPLLWTCRLSSKARWSRPNAPAWGWNYDMTPSRSTGWTPRLSALLSFPGRYTICMNTSTGLPAFLDPAVAHGTQRDLFGEADAPAAPAYTLYAEVVFDRPLDHAYSYAVPESVQNTIAVGKRVAAPFGKGDKATVGYCVGLSETAPSRAVKELLRVLDDEALLTP